MNLPPINLSVILPIIILSGVGIVIMVAEPFMSRLNKSRLGWLGLIGVVAALFALFPMADNRGQWYSNLLDRGRL